ncbi:MAG: hypothetical protein ABSH49_06880 [Bryobacteraceae bacterium]
MLKAASLRQWLVSDLLAMQRSTDVGMIVRAALPGGRLGRIWRGGHTGRLALPEFPPNCRQSRGGRITGPKLPDNKGLGKKQNLAADALREFSEFSGNW